MKTGFMIGAMLMFAAATFGCAPRAAVDQRLRADAVAIQVEHNIPAAPSLTVFLIDPIGPRRLLGTVSPGQVGTLAIDPRFAAGQYRLLAETPDGRAAASRPFPLPAEESVRWNLRMNTVTPVARPDAR